MAMIGFKCGLKFVILTIIVLALHGCSTVDYQITSFRLVSEQAESKTFAYTAFADAVYPVDSVEAEKQRMEWLNKWLSQNNLTTTDYVIIKREVYKKHKGLLGETYDIYYTVQVPKK